MHELRKGNTEIAGLEPGTKQNTEEREAMAYIVHSFISAHG